MLMFVNIQKRKNLNISQHAKRKNVRFCKVQKNSFGHKMPYKKGEVLLGCNS